MSRPSRQQSETDQPEEGTHSLETKNGPASVESRAVGQCDEIVGEHEKGSGGLEKGQF